MSDKLWEVLHEGPVNDIVNILLINRGVVNKEIFFNPPHPDSFSLSDLEISGSSVKKGIERIKKAISEKEKIIVFGDYDADGVTATAIMWESLNSLGADVTPYIPDRFNEGYGINPESISIIHKKYPDASLIITVDNGIVADKGVGEAVQYGIDVIITDHHMKDDKEVDAFSVVHTTKISGSAVSWVFARELIRDFDGDIINHNRRLELVAIGTVADLLPVIDMNRAFVVHGIEALRKTKRIGLLKLFEVAGIKQSDIGTYEIGFLIAPRLNAMGRLTHAIDSLRLLCTTSDQRADSLSKQIGKVNKERQKIVEEVVISAREHAKKSKHDSIILIADESYHEGVIGLAASKLVEEFYLPSIVISKSADISKASCRSISGFDIISAIRELSDLLLEVGGHTMAAGFSIETKNIEEFSGKLNLIAKEKLTKEILKRKLTVDAEIPFDYLKWDLVDNLSMFAPFGIGNREPTFVSRDVNIKDSKLVGSAGKHAKLKLSQGDKYFDAIAFGLGEIAQKFNMDDKIDIVYNFEKNFWNGSQSLQLKIKDLRLT